jgi:hypothetical protein
VSRVTTPEESPALSKQSELYPQRYEGRVPLRVRLTKTVTADVMPYPLCLTQDHLAMVIGQEVSVWVNSHGAVAGIDAEGRCLGLKPDEFEVVQFHGELRS